MAKMVDGKRQGLVGRQLGFSLSSQLPTGKAQAESGEKGGGGGVVESIKRCSASFISGAG